MNLWQDAPGEKLTIPIWWLESHIDRLNEHENLSLRLNAQEIRAQIDAAKKRDERLRKARINPWT